jgi:6,7-dimethyl-8-ribityllumazine synthase
MPPRTLVGKLDGKKLNIALVVSRFSDRLLQAALDCLIRHGVAEQDITITRVPGALEIPIAAQRLARSKRFDAVICLGCVIRGETPHYDQVCAEVARGISTAGLESGLPVIFGVLTVEDLNQAIERAGAKGGNKGWDAALTAIEMVSLLKTLK